MLPPTTLSVDTRGWWWLPLALSDGEGENEKAAPVPARALLKTSSCRPRDNEGVRQ
jgi:hypothetical protein